METKNNPKIDTRVRHEVTYVRDGLFHRKGETSMVGVVMARTLFRKGLVAPSKALLDEAARRGVSDWFKAKK